MGVDAEDVRVGSRPVGVVGATTGGWLVSMKWTAVDLGTIAGIVDDMADVAVQR